MYVYMYVSPTNIHTSILGAAVGMYVCCLDNQLTNIHTSWGGVGRLTIAYIDTYIPARVPRQKVCMYVSLKDSL